MATGTIIYWNEAKGFGFARKEDGGEAFVHVSAILDETIEALEVGQHIAFDEQPSKRGSKPEAVEVKLLTTTKTKAKDREPPASVPAEPPATPTPTPTPTTMVEAKEPQGAD